MALAEFELIKRYFNTESLSFPRAGIVLGPGDDCAILDVPAGQQLVMSMDMLNADVHFPAGADAAQLAQRCLRVNLSDLAAMGAEPLGFTLALSLSAVDEDWLAGFSKGLGDCARAHNCSLLGGDTTRGPLAVTIQVHGLVPAGQALRRDGAQAGDSIYVTGTLGDAALALPYLIGEHEPANLPPEDYQYLLAAFYQPVARIKAGMQLRGLASAAIDISDGLASDLRHVLTASGSDAAPLGAVLDISSVPISEVFMRTAPAMGNVMLALCGGDDYELCVTVPPAHEAQAVAAMQSLGLRFTRIGQVCPGSAVLMRDEQGELTALSQSGYRHFGEV